MTEQERYLTALVRAGDRLSRRVCIRVRLQQGDFLWLERGMLGSGTVHFETGETTGGSAAGGESRQTCESSGAEKGP